MRVIAGKSRGSKLAALEGLETRPTLDRVKEVMFSIIQYSIIGCRGLDLFAGSGQLGIEALSRGALHVDFVEKNPKAASIIRKNLEKTRFIESAAVHVQDVFEFLSFFTGSFDFVFMDPPYNKGMLNKTLELLPVRNLLNPGAILVLEHELGLEIEKNHNLNLFRTREFSDSALSFFKYDKTILEEE